MRAALSLLAIWTWVLTTSASAQSTGAAAESPMLKPGDILQVTIWREEDLSGEFQVNEEGVVVLPLLGRREVAGVPLRQLRDRLLEEYLTQLRNPSIQIVPLRRIYVLGEVNQPGMYKVDPTISLAGAVALSGGASPTGDLNRIRIVRNGEVIQDGVAAESSLVSIDVQSGDQIFIGKRPWIARNSTFLISMLLAIPGIVATVLSITG